MTLLIHSQSPKLQSLKVGIGQVILSHIYCACDYLSMLELK